MKREREIVNFISEPFLHFFYCELSIVSNTYSELKNKYLLVLGVLIMLITRNALVLLVIFYFCLLMDFRFPVNGC